MGAPCKVSLNTCEGDPARAGISSVTREPRHRMTARNQLMTVTDRQPRYLVRAAVAAVETGGFASPSHDGFALALDISRAAFVLEGKRLQDPTFACCNSIKQHGSRFRQLPAAWPSCTVTSVTGRGAVQSRLRHTFRCWRWRPGLPGRQRHLRTSTQTASSAPAHRADCHCSWRRLRIASPRSRAPTSHWR
jgi:hypothetical protein